MRAPTAVTRQSRIALADELHELALRCAEEGLAGHAERLLAEARGLLGERPAAGPALAGDDFVLASVRAIDGTSRQPLPMLDVTSLGRFTITYGGRRLEPCRSRRAIWILRYLLATPANAAHKGELASDLWPDAPGDRAQHSLHVAVAALRGYLDPAGARESVIRFASDRYTLSPAVVVHDDCASFQALVALGDRYWHGGETGLAGRAYNAALELYHGDYDLTELEFEWALEEQRRHADAYLHALWRAGAAARASGHHEAAIECYGQLLARDPYREDVVAEIMAAYVSVGRRADAAREYARCAAYLESDLGIEPSRELKLLYRRLIGVDPGTLPIASNLRRIPLQAL